MEQPFPSKANEVLYRAVFDSASGTADALVIADFDLNILDINDQACVLTGYTREEMLARNARMFFPVETVNEVLQSLQKEQAVAFETEAVRKDGTKISAGLRAQRMETSDGEQVLIALRHKTEPAQTQEPLRYGEELLRLLIEHPSDIIVIANDVGTIRYGSLSLERILGYQQEDILGKSVFEFVHPDDLPKVINTFTDATQNPNVLYSLEHRFRHKDGSWCFVESIGKRFHSETEGVMVVINMRNITERRQMEEELNRQRSYFQHLFENSPDGIVILDNTDRILDANKGFERLFQYPIEDIRGRYLNDIIVPKHLTEEASALSRGVLDKGIVHKETMRKRRDGSLVNVSIFGYPIMLGSNQIGVYGIYTDITERKQAEEVLVKLRIALEASNEVVFLTDPNGIITFVNPELTSTLPLRWSVKSPRAC
jgi:PAS domain S-box-containing protein